jgi:hypothetical protein
MNGATYAHAPAKARVFDVRHAGVLVLIDAGR